ncbi:TetR/AcrR family transcriptional regulator [Ensifer sp.]|uniref:TetR/AcrR family transcriptional regulator n=1 Tax=Ensifer sp. TaxID=1872086 RepID=UPI00289A313A|nr:TetR/AcrR family transcriptional regulator [Ensifer sp.]
MVTQAERREATRSAVIRAATTLFGTVGFAATTVDQIAGEARVAKGAVYHHFANKEAIFAAVFEVTSREVAARVAAAGRLAVDPLKGISEGTRTYFEICTDGGPIGRIILTDGPAVLGWRVWRDIDRQHFGAMVPAALAAAMKTGLVDSQPIEPLSALLLGAVTEAAFVCANSHAPEKAIEAFISALDALLQGLCPRV